MQVDEVEVKQEKISSQFQNRLVGIIVLVALGVIFLPDILDGKKQHQEEQFAEIPLRPQFESDSNALQSFEPIDLSEQEEQFNQNLPASETDSTTASGSTSSAKPGDSGSSNPEASNSALSKNEPSKTEAVKQDSKATSEPAVASSAYTLQLGSFKNAANVNALVKRLRDQGYRAYTVPKKPVDGQLTKVFVGPDISKAKLQKLQTKLDKFTGLKSAVVDYNPLL